MRPSLQNKKRKFDRERDDKDERDKAAEEPPEDPLKDATTLYVGNLSFYTTEEQIHELFAKWVILLDTIRKNADAEVQMW
ncbi:MAG: nuclear cap binding complex subunit [Piccolia ochrophora]|nr:MAG: nuclear cap binding complex subunit [Piccolia ochrophora]